MFRAIFALLISVLITACTNPGSTEKTITEHGLAGSSVMLIEAGQLGGIHLESAGADPSTHPGSDTGDVGHDRALYAIDTTGTHNFCFEDDDGEFHRMTLQHPDGTQYVDIIAGTGCVSVSLESGEYIMDIYHGGDFDDDTPDTIFIQSGSIDTADETTATINHKLTTNVCDPCNLNNADFSYANLKGAYIRSTVTINRNINMSHANLQNSIIQIQLVENADFSHADLSGAMVYGGYFFDSTFEHATIIDATLNGVFLRNNNFKFADLSRVKTPSHYSEIDRRWVKTSFYESDFSNAILIDADLREVILDEPYLDPFTPHEPVKFVDADLTGANLDGLSLDNVTLQGATLDNATWIDGRVCAEGSVGWCQ